MRFRFHDKEEFMRQEIIKELQKKKIHRWCKKHCPSIWADGYKQCSKGWKLKEECEEG